MSSDIASLSLDQIARALGGKVTRNSKGQPCVLAPGPGHSAKDKSLSIMLASSAEGGFVVHSFSPKDDPIACKDWVRQQLGSPPFKPSRKRGDGHAKPARTATTSKASPEEIAAANATAREAMAAPASNSQTQQRKQVAVYNYADVDGTLLYQVRRFEPKDFRQYRSDGNGGWLPGISGVRRVPYHLPDLIAFDSALIFLCEGEKDADRLRTLPSLCATTLSGGTKWTPEIAEYFGGRDVIIVPDHDPAGQQKACQAASALHGVAASTRVVRLPDLSGQKSDKDVSDWLDADPTRADSFVDICLATPLWTPQPPPQLGEPTEGDGIMLSDFYAYMPMHTYIFVPSREMWPASSVNAQIQPIMEDGKSIKASQWMDSNRAVTQMTWAPGLPLEIPDQIISDGGWSERKGITCLNLYKPPTIQPGNATGADRWVEHVHKVYPDDADHIIRYLAHRVQRPQEKINHALFLGGNPGIGKDTLLAPVKTAIGPWNFQEVSPKTMLGNFNGFAKAVILRVSEARDLGDVNRYIFYDATKTYAAAPPDVLRVNEKNLREPIAAAFFAIEELPTDTPQSDIVIWALHRLKAADVKTNGVNFPNGPGGQPLLVQPTLRVVRPPVRDNPYLAAQSALFTTIDAAGIYFMQNDGVRPSVEDFVAKSQPSQTVLRKLVLSHEYVPDLLEILEREQMSRSALMPTMDNIATDVRKRWVKWNSS